MADDIQQSDYWTAPLCREARRMLSFTPDEFRLAAMEYFNWCSNNPLYDTDIRTAEGTVVITPIAKMRPFTLRAFLVYAGIARTTWNHYAETPGFVEICAMIQDIIYTQKFEGAATGLLNPNFIARDLGMADGVDHRSSDGTMSPKSAITINTSKMSDKSMEEFLEAIDADNSNAG